MRLLAFSGRTAKEILRDPLNLFFGLGFPLVLIGLLTAIQANIPVPMFELDNLTPGITVFGLSFMTLFAAVLISKDRESALLQRLYTTPLTASDFIFGYTLPILPIAVAQGVICYIAAALLGLKLTITVLYALLFLIPVALFYIALGLICGSVFNSKQVGGICGALLTNLSAWMSGIWFDVDLVGGVFKKIANALPFIHAVELERAVFSADYSGKVMRLVPYGKLLTVGAIREYFANENGADFTEPITAGIFVSIVAWASYQRSKDVTPYWRTLKANGELNAKYPGSIEAQKEKLEAEGHTIVQKGRKNIRYYVKDYERALFVL